MDTIRLAYRDHDRTPVIFCIQEMARRHYDLNVEVLHVQDTEGYEAAIFDGTADLICEHLEYLFQEAVQSGRKATIFLCPVGETDTRLVVAPEVYGTFDLRGRKIAVRTHGRPYAINMQLRHIGLEGSVELLPVSDDEVGRWNQWKKLLTGECAATFIPCLKLEPALDAGLRVLPVRQLEIVGHFHHACASEFARTHDDLMRRYVQATIHAIALMKLRRAEALEIVAGEAARRMRLEGKPLEHAFDCIAAQLQFKPYPTPAGIANSYEIACAEWPGGKGINPVSLWDVHWVKQLDDEGFIDDLAARLKA